MEGFTITKLSKEEVDERVKKIMGCSLNYYRSVKPTWSRQQAWYDIMEFGQEGIVAKFMGYNYHFITLVPWHCVASIV